MAETFDPGSSEDGARGPGYALKFFKLVDGEFQQCGTGAWHGFFPFLALQRAAELSRDLGADAFEVTTPEGATRRFTIDGAGTAIRHPVPNVTLADMIDAMARI